MNSALSPIDSQFATTDKAVAYGVWFSAKVEKSLEIANQPDSVRTPHDEVMSKAQARIEAKKMNLNLVRRLA